MPSLHPTVRTIKTYTVTPRPNPQAPRQFHLSSWDVAMLSSHYIQKGLLFAYPPDLSVEQIIEGLRSSLEEALFHFYPLSGRLRVATCDEGGVTCHVEMGYEGKGAEFVHAVADGIRIADVMAADGQDLPKFLKEFFPLDLAVNFDGCSNPLLSVQVTELIGGIFIGCAFNHVIGDGTSFWHFFNAWAEITQCKAVGKDVMLSRPPVHNRWFIGDYGEPPIKLPYSSPAKFVVRFSPPPLRERMFHFSSESLAKLKAKANRECGKSISLII
ncbi:HXXXD-type acyl-transferase-like protein [Rhynchospora pubera]|uniref:HXXXD-type acyl-transferase-like protein n=1 Tax=Rhynchospora pubera TaxID=906938 RepID=A0AAV8GX12_9POAL|nr:HXXXD-type acyl-transferase-like protein [Rhynchospora pubera]